MHLIAELLFIYDIYGIKTYAVIALSLVICYGPTLYYYIRKLHDLPTPNLTWHTLPYLLGLWSIFYIHRSDIQTLPEWVLSIYYSSILLIYCIASLQLTSSRPVKKYIDWTNTLAIGFGTLVLLYILEAIWINLGLPSKEFVVRTSTSIFNVFCFVFLLNTIKQIITNPEAFSELKIRIPYKNVPIPLNSVAMKLITSFIIDNKAYKDPKINRNKIAMETGIHINQISQFINSTYQKNINDWINDLRIEEASIYLKETNLSIKEIYFEIGFNSKSAFNTAFKKRMGITPSQFRLINGK